MGLRFGAGQQLRIARGRKLRHNQEDITIKGWAIECRINAEDPYNNYLPSIGQISQVILPTGPGVRLDTGVFAGMNVSPYYDSLISKLICFFNFSSDRISPITLSFYKKIIFFNSIYEHHCFS